MPHDAETSGGYSAPMAPGRTDGTGQERERVAASVVLPCIDPDDGSSILVCHDDYGFVGPVLASQGRTVHSWWRLATPGHGAAPWPDGGPHGSAVLRLSKDKTAFEMALHAVCSVLTEGASVWVYGANDEGIKSAPKVMSTVLTDVRTVDTRKHCRVLVGRTARGSTTIRSQLSDWVQTETLTHSDGPIDHTTYPGVFAKGKLDSATQLLIETMEATRLPREADRVLDYACGAGVIGGWLKRRQPGIELTMLDADAVSATAAQKNVPDAHTVVGASLKDLEPCPPFNCIVSNPPIHVGKARDYGVLHTLIPASRAHLKPGGTLWLVVQRQADIEGLLARTFRKAGVAAEDGRFRVWRAD